MPISQTNKRANIYIHIYTNIYLIICIIKYIHVYVYLVIFNLVDENVILFFNFSAKLIFRFDIYFVAPFRSSLFLHLLFGIFLFLSTLYI